MRKPTSAWLTQHTFINYCRSKEFKMWFLDKVRSYQPDFEVGDKTKTGIMTAIYYDFVKECPEIHKEYGIAGSPSFISTVTVAGLRANSYHHSGKRGNASPASNGSVVTAKATTTTAQDDIAVISRGEWNELLSAVSRIENAMKKTPALPAKKKRGWF